MMNWKLKAKIQNGISLLPSTVSYAVYYWVQRRFGGLKQISPIPRFTAAIETWKLIEARGEIPEGKVFFEVGTGRVPHVPIAYWLMGAERTVTIDLNPYLKEELVAESLQYIFRNKEEILHLFGPMINMERFNKMEELSRDPHFSVTRLLDLCQVRYVAPGDASDTHLPENSIDFHTSYTVFEHIPPDVLKSILEEGCRLIRSNGLFIHNIDYSDHFAHGDKSISRINFLQFSDREWNRIAGNRYMYMNRLRHDDYLMIFQSAGHSIIVDQPEIDPPSLRALMDGGLKIDERFSSKSSVVLAVTGAWIISKKIEDEA